MQAPYRNSSSADLALDAAMVADLCQTPHSVVFRPCDDTGELDESESLKHAPAFPRRSEDPRIGSPATIYRIHAQEYQSDDKVEVCDPFTTIRDTPSRGLDLLLVGAGWGSGEDGVLDERVVSRIVECWANEESWEEEAAEGQPRRLVLPRVGP
jgi:hypothetical protein